MIRRLFSSVISVGASSLRLIRNPVITKNGQGLTIFGHSTAHNKPQEGIYYKKACHKTCILLSKSIFKEKVKQ